MRDLVVGDPRTVGDYAVLGRLGRGAMGTVYLGRSPGGRLVAVKVARAGLAEDPDFRARFRNEIAMARAVGGFWTAAVVAADPDADRPWLATEYVAGPTLTEVVRASGPLPEPVLRALLAGLAEALTAIHTAGLVHRDLKPSNVLLAADGPRVIDFGIAKALHGTAMTATGVLFGTPGYLSPEQISGHEVGPPSDVFALGAVIVYAAAGQGPFGEAEPHALLYRAVHTGPNLTGVPSALRPVLSRCLNTRPELRPTTAELIEESGCTWLPGTASSVVPSRTRAVPEGWPVGPDPGQEPSTPAQSGGRSARAAADAPPTRAWPGDWLAGVDPAPSPAASDGVSPRTRVWSGGQSADVDSGRDRSSAVPGTSAQSVGAGSDVPPTRAWPEGGPASVDPAPSPVVSDGVSPRTRVWFGEQSADVGSGQDHSSAVPGTRAQSEGRSARAAADAPPTRAWPGDWLAGVDPAPSPAASDGVPPRTRVWSGEQSADVDSGRDRSSAASGTRAQPGAGVPPTRAWPEGGQSGAGPAPSPVVSGGVSPRTRVWSGERPADVDSGRARRSTVAVESGVALARLELRTGRAVPLLWASAAVVAMVVPFLVATASSDSTVVAGCVAVVVLLGLQAVRGVLRALRTRRQAVAVTGVGLWVSSGAGERQLRWSEITRVRVVGDAKPWLVLWLRDPHTGKDLGKRFSRRHGGVRVYPVSHHLSPRRRHRDTDDLRAALHRHAPDAYDPAP
ncbi:protein kinase domain-containing protein [Actinokineospora inagensis]|uniref:protein kinase domain-containing protein n=1 Tax=Actinokineospora inagensis TaxID=103730 RepID=UPI000428CF3A|nr:serine/threonine-protein kinase [Actinokineospora inagensis]